MLFVRRWGVFIFLFFEACAWKVSNDATYAEIGGEKRAHAQYILGVPPTLMEFPTMMGSDTSRVFLV